MENRQLGIIEAVLTDANEYVLNQKMKTEDFGRALEPMDQVGYYAIECMAGSMFKTAFETLDDPWERLSVIRKKVKKTKLLLTMHGTRIFSDQPYPDSAVAFFVEACAKNGIDIFRIYDEENDLRQLKAAVCAAKNAGAEVQVSLTYYEDEEITTLVSKAIEACEMGADAISVRDLDGVLKPDIAAELFGLMSIAVSVPLGLQMHQCHGMADMVYMKAVERGCTLIDTVTASLSAVSSCPATEVMAEAFRRSEYAAPLDYAAMARVDQELRRLSTAYLDQKVISMDKYLLNQKNAEKERAAEELLYDELTLSDVRQIRREIALFEKNPLDAVTFVLYPAETKDYLRKRAQ